MNIKNIVAFVVKQLVASPEAVTVTERTDSEGNMVFEIGVDDLDRGKVIGREGHTIKAIRSLITALTDNVSIQIVISPAASQSQ